MGGAVDFIIDPPAASALTSADLVAAAPVTVSPADANAAALEQLKSELRAIEKMCKEEEEDGEIPYYFIKSTVDGQRMNYFQYKKKVYTPVEEILKMTPNDVAAYRKQLQIEIIGDDDVLFNPIKTWEHAGLPWEIAYPIADLEHEKPMPIQAQALPVIMSGRDCIALAGKGSGKTLAYVVPMLKHIYKAIYLGAIGIVISPNRDLAEQVYQILAHFNEDRTICSLVPVFRGNVTKLTPRGQVGPCVVICTPETGYDARKIINYRRTTFVVIDDADVIVDVGLIKQVLDIIQCTRTDCQTVVFSTTFQPDLELLARAVTMDPVLIHRVEKLDVGEGEEGQREVKRLKRAAV